MCGLKTSNWSQFDTPTKSPLMRADDLIRRTRDSTEDQHLLERLYVICAVEMQDQLQASTCTKPHFERFRSWMSDEFERFKQPAGVPFVPDSAKVVAMTSADRQRAISQYRQDAKDTYMWPVVEAACRVYENMIDVVEGRKKLLKILMEDNLLPQFYDWANELSDPRPLFETMGHSMPDLRVLEIGAGTGGTTSRALAGLKSSSGEPLYSNYTFTDISDTFFPAARQRFNEHENMEFCKLDVSQDPLKQGFQAGSFDLIVAANVLHATPCLVQTLKNCRTLLKPDGFLYMQELSSPGKYIQFIVGLFPGWWLGDHDGRPDGPCIPPSEWDRRLQQAGFDGLSAVAYDNELPCYFNANMLAQRSLESHTSS